MNNSNKKNSKINRSQSIVAERDPISDIRVPLMILFLWAAVSSFYIDLPSWVTLPVAAVVAATWAIIRERGLIIALSINWKTYWVLLAPIVSFLLYALLDVAIQSVSVSLISGGGLNGNRELPALFTWLVSLRASAGDIPPVLLGLGGAIVLGIGEEFFWRGFVQTRLMLVIGHGTASLITAILYGVFYLFALGTMAAVLSLFLGIVLSMFTLRSRSLLPAILCHASFLIFSLWLRPDISGIV
ncbi:MAG: CPBP family intramembrane metalloprotease [Deltaproteobacteria bacterium]|nr:CPBP family intramembrane metalloprotease [Deltaproteobacteria bacterium]